MCCDHHPEAEHLMKLGRTAIWSNKKIIILISMIIWMVDVGFLISGEYGPSADHRGISYKPGGITGAARVNFSTLTILDVLGLFTHCRSVICGPQSSSTASCSIQRA
jgi:hypothetical protein